MASNGSSAQATARCLAVVLVRGGERHRPPCPLRLDRLLDRTLVAARLASELGERRRPREAGGETRPRAVQGDGQLGETARHTDDGGPVTQVVLDLAGDRGNGEAREVGPSLGIEALDRLDQADRAHLDEVVEPLPTSGRSGARASVRAAGTARSGARALLDPLSRDRRA